jgi:ankyrin repeat protein/ABC-type transporter Mla MlaB component
MIHPILLCNSFNFQLAIKRKSFDSSSQLGFNTYKKRAGTTDLDKDYEKLMCALFALKFSTSDIVADFEMKTNSDDCGDFDGVVLKVTFVDGQSQMFLLQLKHSKIMKDVTGNMLAKAKGFGILKYKESIQEFENTENVSFILYTNNSTSIKNNSKIGLQNKDNTIEEVVVSELQPLDHEKRLLMTRKGISDKKEGTKVFQFKSNQSSESVKGLDEFLKRFYFFAHQTNTTGAQLLINAMLNEECGINDATYSSSFLQFMQTWWSDKFILTKYDVVAKLAELTLTPFIQTISDRKCNEKSKVLREAIMKFDMTIVRDTNEEVVANIWNETASDHEISLTSLRYGLGPYWILPSKVKSKVLWHLNKVPLIVKAEECHKRQVTHAIRLLEKVEKKKIVLLGTTTTKEEFPGWNIFQDLSDLSKEDVYKDIIKHFAVSLQGRPQIFLYQLLNFDQENDRTIETTELIKMTQKVIQIGRKQEKVCENYIPRSVSTISLDMTKLSQFCKTEDSLVIICRVSQPWNEAIRQLDLHVTELDQYLKERTKCDVILTNKEWPQVGFNEICEQTKRNVHLLQVFNDNSCTLVKTNENKFSLETMKSEGARVNEMEIFTYLDHPLNVICSPPGMGKSTLMSRLSSICPSSYWTVRVNLINHQRVFKKKFVHDEILQHFLQDENDPLVVKIRSMLLQNKRMYFFLDGLDEVDSDCLHIVLDFIKYISSLGHRVWITSRENLEQTLLEELNIFTIKIEELTEQQQKAYIQKRLQDLYQEDQVEHITNKIFANVHIVNSRHLLGLPSQLSMVIENFRDNKNLWEKPDQEIFVLTKMYKIFFQGKKKHQHQKLGVHEYENQLEQYELPALKSCLDTTTFDKLKINSRRSQMFLEKLKTGDPFGIVSGVTDDNQAIFSHQTYAEYFACAWLKNNLDKVSLLQGDLFTKENENLKLIFDIMLAENSAVHLAVIYRNTDLVLKHLDKSEVKDEGGRSALQLLCTYGVEHPLLVKEEDKSSSPGKKQYAENILEGVSTQYREIFKMLSHCDVFQNDNFFQKDNVFQWNCLDYAIRFRNLFAVEKLLERFGNSIGLENLFESYNTATLAYYSSQMGYANLLSAAIEKDPNVLSVEIGTCHLTLLHVAIMAIKENKKYEQTLLGESIEVIKTLICGLDVNEQCICKRTALHFASELDDDVIVKFLLKKGANINLTDKHGQNALHFAFKNSKVNMGIVNVLIEEGIARDVYAKTPLHFCCREGHYEALKKLLDHGFDVKVATEEKINLIDLIHTGNSNEDPDVNGKKGCTALCCIYNVNYNVLTAPVQSGKEINATNNYKTLRHTILSDNSNAKIITFLIENDASVNVKDSANRSVLHYAASQRYYNCIKVLLDHDADINAVDNSGKTVLHAALENKSFPNVEVIQLLLSRGVDANKRDRYQKTALDYAVTSTRSDRVVNILFNAKAHKQLMSTDCVTFLHYAVYHGNDFAVELFLECGLDLDKIDVNINKEEYPLYFAAESENQHLRSDLLLKMTEFIRDCKKKANFGRKQIIELLKKYFSEGYGSDYVSLFNINLCFLFVYFSKSYNTC